MKIGAGDDKNDKDDKPNDEKEHTDDMGDGINETKDDKNDKFNEEQDEKYPDVPSPVYIEEGYKKDYNVTTPDSTDRGVYEEKDEDNETNDYEIEAESSVLHPPVDVEECVGKAINDKNDRIDEDTSEGDNSDSVIPTVNDAVNLAMTDRKSEVNTT